VNRRDFLKYTGQAIVAAGLLPYGCGSGSSASVQSPRPTMVGERRLIYDHNNNLYELISLEHKLVRYNADGSVLWEKGGLGDAPGQLNYPMEMKPGPNGLLYIVDHGDSEIEVVDENGNALFQIGDPGTGDDDLNYPNDIAVDEDGFLYVCDAHNHRIQVFDPEGNPARRFGELGTEGAMLNHPESVDISPNGEVHVVDSGNARVQMYSKEGDYLGSYGSYGQDDGQFLDPSAIVIDSNGFSYVSDAVSGYVQVFNGSHGPVERYKPTLDDGRIAIPLCVDWAPEETLYIYAQPGFDPTAVQA